MKIRNPMKLSDKTISVLKNFSSINQSILFKEGNKLRTISVMKNILAEATITEEFAKDLCPTTALIVEETTTFGTHASANTSTQRLVKERDSFLGMTELSCNFLLLVVLSLLLVNEAGF